MVNTANFDALVSYVGPTTIVFYIYDTGDAKQKTGYTMVVGMDKAM